jgi:hypothetical protein
MFGPRENQVMAAEARIDDMAFFDEASAGGAFRLSAAATEDSSERIGAWTIEVRAGSEIVVHVGRQARRTRRRATPHLLPRIRASTSCVCVAAHP